MNVKSLEHEYKEFMKTHELVKEMGQPVCYSKEGDAGTGLYKYFCCKNCVDGICAPGGQPWPYCFCCWTCLFPYAFLCCVKSVCCFCEDVRKEKSNRVVLFNDYLIRLGKTKSGNVELLDCSPMHLPPFPPFLSSSPPLPPFLGLQPFGFFPFLSSPSSLSSSSGFSSCLSSGFSPSGFSPSGFSPSGFSPSGFSPLHLPPFPPFLSSSPPLPP